MEVKKIIAFVVIMAFLPLSCDITQYKRIGDTHFYLLRPDWEGKGAHLYHDGGDPDPVGFFSIKHEGIVTDVYWNRQYVIIKCIQSENDATKYRYIMKNTEDYDWKELEVRQFLNVMDYKMAIDSLGLSENKMEHTDGTIPWRIF